MNIEVGSIVYWVFQNKMHSGKVVKIDPHLPCEDENYDRFWLEDGGFIERWNIIDYKG